MMTWLIWFSPGSQSIITSNNSPCFPCISPLGRQEPSNTSLSPPRRHLQPTTPLESSLHFWGTVRASRIPSSSRDRQKAGTLGQQWFWSCHLATDYFPVSLSISPPMHIWAVPHSHFGSGLGETLLGHIENFLLRNWYFSVQIEITKWLHFKAGSSFQNSLSRNLIL